MKESIKKRKKNREILIIACTFLAVFAYMIGFFVVYAASHEEELINNSYNNRQQILVAENTRGKILSSDGEILAYTQKNAEGKEERIYPFDSLFCHTVGYFGKGKTGLESQFNYYLISSDISEKEKVENQIANEKNPGNDLHATFSLKLQEAADKAMGMYKGAIICMEAKTGRILAMVSKPDFDANTIAENWDAYLADTEKSVLLNRATQGLYPPGSTFKIITSLEYLKEKDNQYQNYHYNCNGKFIVGDEKIKCYHGMHHGALDFKQSFAKSCNSSFANIGMQLNRGDFSATCSDLYFRKELPVDFPTSVSSIDLHDGVSDADVLQASIGQGKTGMSPIHLAMITEAVANGGDMMKPYMADCILNANGDEVKSFKPTKLATVMTKEQADILTDFMKSVVESGTGKKLSDAGYVVAGKTGSAEFTNSTSDSHAWFTGFAPADDPEIVVTVIIENAGSGGDYAVPMARRVFDAWFS